MEIKPPVWIFLFVLLCIDWRDSKMQNMKEASLKAAQQNLLPPSQEKKV